MAINRFWNKVPTVGYTPQTMQEMAYAPQIMYQRDQDLTAKVDAMNEAKASISSLLGENAGKTEEFDSSFKQLTDKINKEGATKANLDLAKNLKQTYIKEVLPQEKYGRELEATMASRMKAEADANNIVWGAPTKSITYDQWRKDPSALQYHVVERDKMVNQGMILGKQFEVQEDTKRIHIDKFGDVVMPSRFKSIEEFYSQYAGDPEFKATVDKMAIDAAGGKGVTNPNSDVLNTIISGISASAVGPTKRRQISEHDKLRMMATGQKPAGGVEVIDEIPVAASTDIDASGNIVNFEAAVKTPIIKAKYDEEISKKSNGTLLNKEQLDLFRKQLLAIRDSVTTENPNWSGEYNGEYANIEDYDINSPTNKASRTLKELDEIERVAKENLVKSGSFNQTVVLDIAKGTTAWLPTEQEKDIIDSRNGAVKDLEKLLGNWKAEDIEEYSPATPDDLANFNEYMNDPNRKEPEWLALRSNSRMTKDGNVGTGNISPTFRMKWGTGAKEKRADISLNLPPTQTLKLLKPLLIAASRHDPSSLDRPANGTDPGYISQETMLKNKWYHYMQYRGAVDAVKVDNAKAVKAAEDKKAAQDSEQIKSPESSILQLKNPSTGVPLSTQ